jgi:hypothetical protein
MAHSGFGGEADLFWGTGFWLGQLPIGEQVKGKIRPAVAWARQSLR